MKVLLVEDEADTRNLLSTYLRKKNHTVMETDNGLDAVRLFYERKPDLMLLDVRMPKLDGWQVLEQVRKHSNIPVIMITALDRGEDAVKGLTLGADDYLRKPFDLSELEARIQTVARRVASLKHTDILQAGAVIIDDRSKEVRVDGREVSLSPREYDLLKLLVSQPNRVFSTEEIIRSVWPGKRNADATDVKQYIHLLRNKIEPVPTDHRLIQTVKGFGYRFSTPSS
jgi:DNA-binding response OmpR family regulator